MLISYSLSKATSEAAENNGPIGLISPHPACLAIPQTEWGMDKPDDGYQCKEELALIVGLTGCPYT